jgi:hypothetical protein
MWWVFLEVWTLFVNSLLFRWFCCLSESSNITHFRGSNRTMLSRNSTFCVHKSIIERLFCWRKREFITTIFRQLDYTASIIRKWVNDGTGKDLVGSVHGLIWRKSYYPSIHLKGLRKTKINLNQDSRSPISRFKPGTSRIRGRSVNHSTTASVRDSSHEIKTAWAWFFLLIS